MPARLLAPSLGAVNTCCADGEETPYLQPHELVASLSYRWLHSFRDFHYDEEVPYPSPKILYANTHVNGFNIALSYQATPRFSFTLEIPIQDGERTSYYEHDFVHRHTMHASGVGDLKLIGNVWLFEPDRHREGNITLGLGVKAPTGNCNAKDFSHRPEGLVLRPVDPAIQPGDGGWGIVTEIDAFQKLFKNAYAYLQGTYLINPYDINGTEQTADEPDFTLGLFGYRFNSVPDQYLGRAGVGYLVWPKMGLSLSLGARVEGVPVEDLIGDNRGWRNAGYAVYIEPGISFAKGRFSVTVTGPKAIRRHADQNTTDIFATKKFGTEFGGYAAFADYLVTASISIRF